jgi:hypothetical protein
MLSPSPKISVLREIFRSLQNALATTAAGKAAAQLKTMI